MSSVFNEVADIVRDVIGEDFLLEQEITPATSFSEDLALESIEFVELSERLQQRFGRRANLATYIAGMDIDAIMDITVGELTLYIADQMAASA
ncbi:MAG TPA: acyl carrier protein [Trebonia sp.]